MTPDQLSDAIVAALTALADEGALSLPDGVPAQVVVERPRSKEHGDYATNVALQLGKRAGIAPRDLATLLAEQLRAVDGIAAVDVAGPGFLNVTVSAGAQGEVDGISSRLAELYPDSNRDKGMYFVELQSALVAHQEFDPERPTPAADRWMESKFAPWARAILEGWAAGEYDDLGQVIFSRADDSAQRLYYYLCELQRRGLVGGPEALIAAMARMRGLAWSVLWLTPAMDGLFAGPAGDRRRFLDRLLPDVGGRCRAESSWAQRTRAIRSTER